MSGEVPKPTQPLSAPPVSSFTGPVGELIAQRMVSPPSRPGVLAMLDKYEILRVLGGGGMGIVLLARNSETGRDAALKLVKPDLVANQQAVHRFLKEAGHLKRLRHPNIVPVEEISDRPEGPYFVMPYFEKGSLANRLKPGRPLDSETILDIAGQLAEGLSFAHRSGIIHRDLKPANILIDARGNVCLADFGLARTLFNDTIVDVESRQLEGTAPYMSPAVAAGDAEDTRCDIYSFGALLYELLTGHPPYQGRSRKEILDQIVAGPPKPIGSLNPAADRSLVAVAECCMARELRDRYADMRDVLKDLQQIKEGRRPVGRHEVRRGLRVSIIIPIAAAVAVMAFLGWIFLGKGHPSTATKTTPPPPSVTKTPSVVTPSTFALTTLAGQLGAAGSADGLANKAQFHSPFDLAVDNAGNVYVVDTSNNNIRKITPAGTVSTAFGLAGNPGASDGKSQVARFLAPFGIALDNSGNIYVADTGNNTIRKITQDGFVSTLAGLAGHPGSADGTGSSAQFRNPWSVAVDSSGSVLVADLSNDAIRRISPDGKVTTWAGQPGKSGNSDGMGDSARFNLPSGVAVDAAGNVYVSDTGNETIRQIGPDRKVITLAGAPGQSGLSDGKGNEARFNHPQGLAMDAAGNLYVADTGNGIIRKISPAGLVSTVPVQSKTAGEAPFKSPGGVALDRAGNIYVADTANQCIRKLSLGITGQP